MSKTVIKVMTFKERIDSKDLTTLSPNFIEFVYSTASANQKTPDEVYSLWKKYCDTCTGYDQSPTLHEFKQWNNLV